MSEGFHCDYEPDPFAHKRSSITLWSVAASIAMSAAAIALAAILGVFIWIGWHGVYTLSGAALR